MQGGPDGVVRRLRAFFVVCQHGIFPVSAVQNDLIFKLLSFMSAGDDIETTTIKHKQYKKDKFRRYNLQKKK